MPKPKPNQPNPCPTALVFCRVPPEESVALKDAFDSLAKALTGVGAPFVVVDSIYDMPDDCAGALFLRDLRGDLILLGWHYPRALKWMLAHHGVEATASSRAVHCINVRGLAPEAVLAKVRELAGTAALQKTARTEPQPEPAIASRWYPVIDGSLCTNCMECLDFCLFGVYGVDRSETLRVVSPDQCRQDCPACARVCPVGAIIFPKYSANVTIAGADAVAGGNGAKLDLSAIFGKPKERQEAMRERDAVRANAGANSAQDEKAEKLSAEFDRLDL